MKRPSPILSLFCCAALFTFTGCSAPGDPQPLLKSLGEIKAVVNEIIAAVEDGDLGKADGPMHDVGAMLNGLPDLMTKAGLPAAGRDAIKTAAQELFKQLDVLHGPMHGGGSLDDIDVPAAIENIQTALSGLESSLPSGWAIPEMADGESMQDKDAHGDAEHDHGEEGHDHDEGHGEEDHSAE